MRRSWILAVVLVLGVLLSGITGYLIWHTVHNSYVKAEVMDGGPGSPSCRTRASLPSRSM